MLIGIDASRATAARLTGTERYSREIIAALIRIAPQHRFRLYFRDLPAPNHAFSIREPESVELVSISARRLWTHIGLARELAAHPPDALFVPAHVLPFSFTRASVQRRMHAVVTVHDVGYRLYPDAHPLTQRRYLDFGTRFSVRHADAVVVDSEATRQDVLHFYGHDIEPEHVVVAYPGALALSEVTTAEVHRVLNKFELHHDQPFALHVGTLQPRKNLRRLIQAWGALASRPEAREARLILAGGRGWGGEDLAGEIDRLKLSGSVRLIGYVNDAEKSALMRCARAYIFPSLYEGFGFPILEAQSVGTPVACSDTSSLPEVAGGAALTFDPLDVDAMADALRRVMFDDTTRARLIEAGYRNVTRFSWEACARIVLNQLEMSDATKTRDLSKT